MLAVALGLAASLSWGLADFVAGIRCRTLESLAVLALSQFAGLAAVVILVAAVGGSPPAAPDLAVAAAAGIVGVVGLGAFYRALAVGAMAVVAPIASLGAGVPVVIGIAAGEQPGPVALGGIVVALAGVALASREVPPEGGEARLSAGVGAAVVAALGIGLFLTLIDAANDGSAAWALLGARVASAATVAAAVVVARPDLLAARPHLRSIAAIGVLDAGANALFILAAAEGLVSVASVLSSLYPVVTILLAWRILGEAVRPVQRIGVVAVLAGVVAIAAG